jgi:hypothetical protein
LQLHTEDLIDFYLPRDHKILPHNTIKNLLIFAGNYHLVKNTFKGIGSCDIIPLRRPIDFEKLAKYYLVLCKPNSNNKSGRIGKGSINFLVSEYIEAFHNKKAQPLLPYSDKVFDIIQKLKHGWNYTIEIIIAYDTSKNIGLIVDGTGHALALYHLSLHKPDLFQELLKRNSNVNLCQMISSQCRNIFSHDFAKLSFSPSN